MISSITFTFTVNGFFDQQKSFLSRVIRSSLRYIFFLFKQLQPNCRLVQPMQKKKIYRQWITKEKGRERKKNDPTVSIRHFYFISLNPSVIMFEIKKQTRGFIWVWVDYGLSGVQHHMVGQYDLCLSGTKVPQNLWNGNLTAIQFSRIDRMLPIRNFI